MAVLRWTASEPNIPPYFRHRQGLSLSSLKLMTSARIQALLHPPDPSLSSKRALDFLDAQFQDWDEVDIEKLRGAADEAARQRDTLAKQLEEATSSRDALVASTLSTAHHSLGSAQELSLNRHELVDRLATLAEEVLPEPGSEKESTLIELERLQGQLEELEGARVYAGVVLRLLELSEAAQEAMRTNAPRSITPSSLPTYRSLLTFVSTLVSTLSSSSPSTLTTFARSVQLQTWSSMRSVLSAKLLAAADKLHWPQAIDLKSLNRPNLEAFSRCFLDMLQFQKAGEVLHSSASSAGAEGQDEGLYPLQALVRPIAQRFRYHFEGSRPTNRLDKPEWYFTHMLGVLKDEASFVEAVFQPLINSGGYPEINAKREFTRLLLPILSRHLLLSTSQLLSSPTPDPSLLAHTIYQALEFDDAIRERGFALEGTWECRGMAKGQRKAWKGLAGELLGSQEIFGAWIEGEKRFAEQEYQTIISSPDAWTIVDASEQPGLEDIAKTTNSARRLRALVEQVTDRYAPLPSFSQRTTFLTVVQLPLLESYHTRISHSLEAFETISSSFIRAVPGALAGPVTAAGGKDLTAGVEGTDRLLKGWVSAEGMIHGMARWGEEVFFLELWTEINTLSSLRSRAAATPTLPDPRPAEDDSEVEGTIFDEMIGHYKKLSKRAEEMIVRHVTGEVEGELKNYFIMRWDTPVSDELGLPPSLVPGLTVLSTHLSFLSLNIPTAFLSTLYRQITFHVSNHVLSRAVLHAGRGRFTPLSGATFMRECQAWLDICRSAVGEKLARPERGWEKLLEAGRVLGLGGAAFGPAARVAWEGNQREYEGLAQALRLRELKRADVKDVMRARADCGR